MWVTRRNRKGSHSVVLGVMLAKSQAFGTGLVALAILVGGCSSGGGKQSTPKKTTPTTTAATAPIIPNGNLPVNTATPRLVANLGPCPSTYPNTPLTKLNAGVAGLDKKLVPIIASRVRVCSYQHLPNGNAAVGSPPPPGAVAQLENETNRLRRRPIYSWRGGCVKYPGTLFVTFASDSQRVDLLANVGCDTPATNGVLHVDPTAKWLTELQADTLPMYNGGPTGQSSGVPTGASG
jgi:hypothetical protein